MGSVLDNKFAQLPEGFWSMAKKTKPKKLKPNLAKTTKKMAGAVKSKLTSYKY